MNFPSTHRTLLDKVRSGNEVSWEEFYERYSPVVRFSGALYGLGDDECADLVQRVMLKFFNAARRFVYREGEVRFRTYFATVIRSEAVDYIRANAARRRAEERAAVDLSADESFERGFMDEWRKLVLKEALEELRSRVEFKTCQAFQLYGLQNRPAAQVAELLDMTVHQVHVAKSRCAAILREIVGRRNAEDGELGLDV
jgi:RNA polymerase sigma-70 factor (ECF subfamily)